MNDGMTLLHFASKNSYLEMVKHLLENGANIEATDCIGRTPLHSASENGQLEKVSFYCKKVPKLTQKIVPERLHYN